MDTNTMIALPLTIMLLLAITSVGGIIGGAAFIVMERDNLQQHQVEQVTERVEHEWGDHRWDFGWYARMWHGVRDNLNNVFGESDGHEFQAKDLIDLRRSKSSSLNENEVENIIKYDPDMIAEMEAISGRGVGLSGTVIFVGILTGLIALVVLMGIHVFGSGLAGASISIAFKLTALFLLWGIFSVMSMDMLTDFPLFGSVLWVCLTGIYTLGVVIRISGKGED